VVEVIGNNMIEHCTVITDIENGLGNEKKEKKF
jgi:hypothetical protein